MVLAAPVASRVSVVAAKVAPAVPRVTVCPFALVALLVHGLDASAHAVTVTLDGVHTRLLVGTDNS